MDPQARATRQWLQRQFHSSGFQLENAALTRLVVEIQACEEPEEFLCALLDEIDNGVRRRSLRGRVRARAPLLSHLASHQPTHPRAQSARTAA